MFKGISLESEPTEKFRERVRRMSDEELIRQGKLVRGLRNDHKPLDVWVQWVVQVECSHFSLG
jgi:hypothetical protein